MVVLTGAGISAESGLKTFRDSNGLWMNYKIEKVATPEAFQENPKRVLDFYNMRRREVASAKPNLAHITLAKLEEDFEVQIVTQNIDDLHERGGSTSVLHLHGEIFKMRSSKNDEILEEIRGDIQLGERAPDGGQWRPHIVWFGEPVPNIEVAAQIMRMADIFLLIGSSLQVYPAAGLIELVPKYVPKFIIDKSIPKLSKTHNLHLISNDATTGIVEFERALQKMLN